MVLAPRRALIEEHCYIHSNLASLLLSITTVFFTRFSLFLKCYITCHLINTIQFIVYNNLLPYLVISCPYGSVTCPYIDVYSFVTAEPILVIFTAQINVHEHYTATLRTLYCH